MEFADGAARHLPFRTPSTTFAQPRSQTVSVCE